jgi:hypothetical protein
MLPSRRGSYETASNPARSADALGQVLGVDQLVDLHIFHSDHVEGCEQRQRRLPVTIPLVALDLLVRAPEEMRAPCDGACCPASGD